MLNQMHGREHVNKWMKSNIKERLIYANIFLTLATPEGSHFMDQLTWEIHIICFWSKKNSVDIDRGHSREEISITKFEDSSLKCY